MTEFEFLKAENEINEINEIINKVQNNQKLTVSETEKYCLLKYSEEKKFDNCKGICLDIKFYHTLLKYKYDLEFKSDYFKIKLGLNDDIKIQAYSIQKEFNESSINNNTYNSYKKSSLNEKLINLGYYEKIEKEEIENDKKYLYKAADEWENIINNTRHKNQELKQTCEETREIINKVKRNGNFSQEKLNHQIRLVLLKSKFFHLEGLKITEYINYPIKLYLNNKEILFTFRSLIHILNGHYGQLISNQLYKLKSYHNPIFIPNKFHEILSEIFNSLSNFNEFKIIEIKENESYNFRYKEVDYQLYFKRISKTNKDLRLSSLYPIEEINEIEKLKGYTLKKISNNLEIYIK